MPRYVTEKHSERLTGQELTQEHENGRELVSETFSKGSTAQESCFYYVFREIEAE